MMICERIQVLLNTAYVYPVHRCWSPDILSTTAGSFCGGNVVFGRPETGKNFHGAVNGQY